MYDDCSDELFVLAGNHAGDLNAINVGFDATSKGKLQRATALKGGHKACARCIYYDKESVTLYTGGEDTRLCKWTVLGTAGAEVSSSRNSSWTAYVK